MTPDPRSLVLSMSLSSRFRARLPAGEPGSGLKCKRVTAAGGIPAISQPGPPLPPISGDVKDSLCLLTSETGSEVTRARTAKPKVSKVDAAVVGGPVQFTSRLGLKLESSSSGSSRKPQIRKQ